MSKEQELITQIEELKRKSKEMEEQIEKLSKTITNQKEYTIHPINHFGGGRQLKPELAKYQEITKIVREASIKKDVSSVSKATKKVLEEAKKLYPTKDFIDQVNEAKKLFISDSKRYL